MSCLHTNKHTHTNKHSLPVQGAFDALEKFTHWKRIIFNTMAMLLLQCSHVLTVVINKIRETEEAFDVFVSLVLQLETFSLVLRLVMHRTSRNC